MPFFVSRCSGRFHRTARLRWTETKVIKGLRAATGPELQALSYFPNGTAGLNHLDE